MIRARRMTLAGVACAVLMLLGGMPTVAGQDAERLRPPTGNLPVGSADVYLFGDGNGVDRQPAYAPLPDGGFVLVYSRYERGDIDSSGLRIAVSTDGSAISSDLPLATNGDVADAPALVTTDDGTWLYFATSDRSLEGIELWRSRMVGTTFAPPERLADVPGLERMVQWPRWVDTGPGVLLTFRGIGAGPAWVAFESGERVGPPRTLAPFAVAYPRVVPMTGGGCFFSYQRPPDGGYMATYYSVSPDCAEWSEPAPIAWPDPPGKPDVHDAFALPRQDAGVDVYYSYPSRKGHDARFDVGFVLYRRAVMPDGTLGPEEQLTDRDAFEPFAPTAHRRPDGTILVSFSDIQARGDVGVSAARMALFALSRDAAP